MAPKGPEAESPSPTNGSVRKRTEALSPSSPRKYRSLAEIMRTAKPSPPVTGEYYSDFRCEQCRSGDRDEEMLLCDSCDKGYHIFCLRPIVVRVPSGPWLCPSCAGERTFQRFPLMQTKIVDFFRIQRCSITAEEEKCRPSQDTRKQRRRSMPLIMHKRRRRILPFNPTEDPVRRIEQMGSLATALTTLQMEFSNELTYMPGKAPRSANQAILEKGGMQVLPREDKETLELCRAMYKRGECPPLLVVYDSLEGFTVQADGHLKDMTLIAEYTGDVDYLLNRQHDDCDSIMTLLSATNPSDSLVVCPDKCGNIARFINGINNHNHTGGRSKPDDSGIHKNWTRTSAIAWIHGHPINYGILPAINFRSNLVLICLIGKRLPHSISRRKLHGWGNTWLETCIDGYVNLLSFSIGSSDVSSKLYLFWIN